MITNTPVLALATWSIVLIVILVVLVAALIGLYFFGRNAEKKQAEQQKTMEANAQTINAFVIDKKKLNLRKPVFQVLFWNSLQNMQEYQRFLLLK